MESGQQTSGIIFDLSLFNADQDADGETDGMDLAVAAQQDLPPSVLELFAAQFGNEQ